MDAYHAFWKASSTRHFAVSSWHVVKGVSPQGKAINEGAAKARGDILIILDDDAQLADATVFQRLIDALDADSTIGMAGASIVPPAGRDAVSAPGREPVSALQHARRRCDKGQRSGLPWLLRDPCEGLSRGGRRARGPHPWVGSGLAGAASRGGIPGCPRAACVYPPSVARRVGRFVANFLPQWIWVGLRLEVPADTVYETAETLDAARSAPRRVWPIASYDSRCVWPVRSCAGRPCDSAPTAPTRSDTCGVC